MLQTIRSVVGYSVLALYTCLVGPPALVLRWITGDASVVIKLGLAGIRMWLSVCGVRFLLVDAHNLPVRRAAVYCVNHTSHLDVVAYLALYPRCPALRILYKRELNQLPLVGRVFAAAGFIAIDRAHHDRAVEALDSAAGALRRGTSLLAAPEGTRSRDGTLQAFKKGIFVTAIRAGAPVVPVAIIGAHDALPKGAFTIRPASLVLRVGEPIETSAFDYEQRDAVIAGVHAALAALLEHRHDKHRESCDN